MVCFKAACSGMIAHILSSRSKLLKKLTGSVSVWLAYVYHDVSTADKVVQELDQVDLPRTGDQVAVDPLVASFVGLDAPANTGIFLLSLQGLLAPSGFLGADELTLEAELRRA